METVDKLYEKWLDVKLAEEKRQEWNNFWKQRGV